MATRKADGGTEPPRPGEDTVTTDDTYRADAADPDEGQKGSDSATDKPEKGTRDRGAERRIRRLVSQRDTAEAAIAQLEKDNDDLRAQLEQLQQQAPKPKKPKLADFENEEAYAEALFAWKAAEDKRPKVPEKKKRASTRGPTKEELSAFLKEGNAEYGEAFATAQDLARQNKFPLSQSMVEYLLESDRGPEVFMELSKQVSDAGRIAQLSAVQTGIEMAKLEGTLEAAGAKGEDDKGGEGSDEQPRDQQGRYEKKRRGTGSNAPPPGPQRDGGGTPGGQNVFTTKTTGGEDARHGDLDDWMAARRKAEQARRRRGL